MAGQIQQATASSADAPFEARGPGLWIPVPMGPDSRLRLHLERERDLE